MVVFLLRSIELVRRVLAEGVASRIQVDRRIHFRVAAVIEEKKCTVLRDIFWDGFTIFAKNFISGKGDRPSVRWRQSGGREKESAGEGAFPVVKKLQKALRVAVTR